MRFFLIFLFVLLTRSAAMLSAPLAPAAPAPPMPAWAGPLGVPGWAMYAAEAGVEPRFPEAELGSPAFFFTLYTSTSCTVGDVEDKFDMASSSGDEVFLDCASATWAADVDWVAPANSKLRGRGCSAAIGGGDLTVITDNYASSAPLLIVDTHATGTFTTCGMTFIAGSTQKDAGLVAFGGQSKSFRMHHMHFDAQTNTVATSLTQLSNHITGVIDHSIFDLHSVGNGIKVEYRNYNGGSQDIGDASWAAATGFGSSDFVVVEDNIFNGNSRFSCVNDLIFGGKMVIRFNTINKAWIQTHPTRQDFRGGRAIEIYGNAFVSASAPGSLSSPHSEAFFHDSGPAILWGNTAPEWYQTFHNAHSARRTWDGNGSHHENRPPDGWGWGGPQPQSGTVTVAAGGLSVTKTAGTNFNTNWVAGDMIFIGSGTTGFRIATVSSTTALTLTDAATPGAGQAYSVGSNWNGNLDLTGYPHIDQPGRGVGDLITGNFPDKENDATGQIYSDPGAWPRQALEPMYNFLNTWVAVPGFGGGLYATSDVIVLNRDIYVEDADCVSGGACPEGVGHGNTLPTTCTTGTGFWKENAGSWRTATPEEGVEYDGQGLLYKCTSTDTWTLYYTPLAYPHPLIDAPPGVATQVSFASTPNTPIASGAALGVITVAVQDGNGTLVSDSTVTVVIDNCSGAFTLGGDTSNAAVAGVATFSDLTATYVPGGSFTLCATSTGLDSDTSASFTITGVSPATIGAGARIRVR